MKSNFKHGDILYFDLTSQEYWVKCKCVLSNSSLNSKASINVNFKLPSNLSLKKLRLQLIYFFIKFYCNSSETEIDYHLALGKFKMKLTKDIKLQTYNEKFLEEKDINSCKYKTQE